MDRGSVEECGRMTSKKVFDSIDGLLSDFDSNEFLHNTL